MYLPRDSNSHCKPFLLLKRQKLAPFSLHSIGPQLSLRTERHLDILFTNINSNSFLASQMKKKKKILTLNIFLF